MWHSGSEFNLFLEENKQTNMFVMKLHKNKF